MDRLWSRDSPATVREMYTDLLRDRQIAYTTVLTVMENLYRKGWLRREPIGRANQYQALTGREQYVARLMREALDDSGDTEQALMHFVGRMTQDEAAALRNALRVHEQKVADE